MASSAAVFLSVYVFALSAVFPVVGSAAVVNSLNASFAFVNSALSALFTNNSAALSKAVFAASTFAWAAWTSSFVALVPFAKALAASVLAASNSALNSSYFLSYAAILSGVLPVSSAFFNESESVCNFVFSSGVAASTRRFLAVSNFVFTASTFAWAAWTSSFVALVPFAKALAASVLAASNSALNSSYFLSYAAILSGVLPVSSAFFNESESVCNFVFSSGVAASIKPSLACCKAVFLAFTVAKASLTSATVAFSLSITVFAASIALIASCFAAL